MHTVYITIGNSDDKLGQKEWSEFAEIVACHVNYHADRIHGEWFSLPNSSFQNACWCIEITESESNYLKSALEQVSKKYGQHAIAWSLAAVEFIGVQDISA